MKITDVTLTLFAWGGIPPTTYGRHTGRFSGESELGLLTLRTDGGLEGHAFLGSAMRSAALDAQSLLRVLKPLVLGQDPLDRERLWQAMWQRNRGTTCLLYTFSEPTRLLSISYAVFCLKKKK